MPAHGPAADRKNLVPPPLPRAPGGLARFGRRVLPVAGTAAALGLGGCATAPQAARPLTPEQRIQQQVEAFTRSVNLPKGKIIKGGSAEDPTALTPPTPVAVAVESSSGMPRDLVPAGVLIKRPLPAEAPAASSAVPAPSIDDILRSGDGFTLASENDLFAVLPDSRARNAATLSATPPVAAPAAAPIQWSRDKSDPSVIEASALASPAAAPDAPPTFDQAMDVLRKSAATRGIYGALAMSLLDGPDARADAGAALDPVDQQVLGDLLSALDKMAGAAPGATLVERAAPLIEAARKWQSHADLSLPRLALASRVDSFGVYTPVAPTFAGGQRHSVIIYCEVANFTSPKDKDGWYVTSLAQQESLITEDGLLVWRPSAEDVEDKSLNQRRDFYMVKKLTIPENLAAGHYVLRMSVTDRNSNKWAMIKLPIEITEK